MSDFDKWFFKRLLKVALNRFSLVFGLFLLPVLVVGWCHCYFDKCETRLMNQVCSCSFPSDCWIWAVFDHDKNRVLFSSQDRRFVVEKFFDLSTESNTLDVVRFDLSEEFLQKSTIFVHK